MSSSVITMWSMLKSVLYNKHFLTWHLIGWRLLYQPMFENLCLSNTWTFLSDPGDGLAPLAGTVLTENLEMSSSNFLWLYLNTYQICKPDDVIQNGRRDIAKSRGISRVNHNARVGGHIGAPVQFTTMFVDKCPQQTVFRNRHFREVQLIQQEIFSKNKCVFKRGAEI